MNANSFRCLAASVALLLAACGGQSPATPVASSTPSPTPAATALPTTVATETPAAPVVELSKSACLEAGGQIETFELESEYLDAGLRLRVYTPPCYAEQEEQRYPVLYLVHGQTYTDDQWDRLGADEAADALIAAGELPPFLIVMPYDISSAQPSVDPFGEAVIEELLPWVDANYRTLAEREYRAVGGLSRGASWAIHLGFTHAELFAAVGGHSPPVFPEDAPQVRGWLEETPAGELPRFWLDIGERDQRAILDSAIWFEDLLTQYDVPHEWHLFTGDHSEAYWSSHVEMYLRWYAQGW